MPSPNPTQQSALLQDVVAVSANDAWAVGNYSNSDGVFLTLAEHWDGSSWSIVSTPNVGSVYDQLYGVSALGSDDVWAVGSTEGPSGRIHTLAEHWDGVSWTVVPTPPTPNQATSLAGVNVISPANVWAVGKTTTRGSSHRLRIRYTTGTLIEHWDGHAWSIVPNPMSGAVLAELWSVSATSPTDVWPAGDATDFYHFVEPPLTEHWNGAKWRAIKGSSPNPGNPLRGVVALAPDDVWVVGATGSGPALQTLAEHADGSAWTVVATPNHTDSELDWLEDVTAIGPADLWAVGYWQSASDGNLRTLVEDWDGSAWTVVPSPNVGVILNELFGVSASPDGDVWAVGERSGTSGTNLFTLTEHYC